MEGIERLALLAHAEKLDRLTGDRPHRKRRTAARITIHLGQHHAGQRQCLIEGPRSIGGILAGHGIDHEQRLHRPDSRMQLLDLGHHFAIDSQATRRIHQHHIDELELGLTNGCFGNRHRLLRNIRRKEGDPYFARQGFQLFDSCRTIDVRRHHHDRLFLTLFKEARQLAHGSGLAGTLQARHENHCRRRCIQRQVLIGRAHHGFQFGLDDLHEGLARRQALGHLATDGTLLDLGHEVLDHWQRHIGLKQGHAHFAQRVLDIVFTELGLAGDMAKRLGKAICEIVEHEDSFARDCGRAASIPKSSSSQHRPCSFTAARLYAKLAAF